MDQGLERNGSASTDSDRQSFSSSDGDMTHTSAWITPCSTLGEDVMEIDKTTFEANVARTTAQTTRKGAQEVNIIDGSTFGGVDPLHQVLVEMQIEPRWWQECRQRAIKPRASAAAKRSQRNAKLRPRPPPPPDPKYYDTLPLSRDTDGGGVTSGFDLSLDPVSSEEFWARLKTAFDLSALFETVHERRDHLERGLVHSGRGTAW